MNSAQVSEDFVKIVREVKSAIQQSITGSGLNVNKIDLEINSIFDKNLEGKLEFKPISLNISGEVKKEDIQTISISLKPDTECSQLMGKNLNIAEQLKDAVVIIKNTVQEAATSEPKYQLDAAEIFLQFQIIEDGNISIILGGGGKSDITHKIKLALGR